MVEQMERMRVADPLKYRHIWLGEYRKLADSAVFRNVRVERLVVPDKVRPYYGLDFGFANDPSALVKLYLFKVDGVLTLYIAQELVAKGIPTERLPAWINQGMPCARRFPIVCDSSRPETVDHLKRNNFAAVSAIKGANSVEDGVAWLQGLQIVVSPDCPVAAQEYKDYEYQVDRQTGKVLPVLKDGDDHVIDASRYATEDERRGGLIIGGTRY
jgi:phage terminase large subunit